MRRPMLLPIVVLATLLAACGGTGTDNSDTVDDLKGDGTGDVGVETDVTCAVPCGGTCCDENWRCNDVTKECYQCAKTSHCSAFAECAGDRCECVDKSCVERTCDQPCPGWQHCEWTDAGMTCAVNECVGGCPTGTRCVADGSDAADACEPYCDKACDLGTHCEWAAGEMACVNDPCDPPECTTDTYCDKGECVPNVCTDLSVDDCEAKGCKCLKNGACGDCTCEPPCEEGFTCNDVDGTMTCEGIICTPPGCAEGEHCVIGDTCVANVCEPPCGAGGVCLVHHGNEFDCDYPCEPECVAGQWCNQGTCQDLPCDLPCSASQHCEWGADQMECVDTVCTPDCALGQKCSWSAAESLATCVTVFCTPACTDYEFCDDKSTCQPIPCEPVCPKTQHCAAQDACVDNDCGGPCPVNFYCGKDGKCIDECQCDPLIYEPICGQGDQSGSSAFQIYDNMCELECAKATVAVCDVLPVQPVCDVAGYLQNPQGANTYDNSCFAACSGVNTDTLQAGACSCAMTCSDDELGDNPVCGLDCDDYMNPCAARCAGTEVQYPHACPHGCGLCSPCDEEVYLDPVCGSNGKTYQSMCDLEVCNPGVDFQYAGICVPGECPCSATSAPVCGTLPGDELWGTLPNACTANCLDASMWFDYVCSACDPRPEAPVCAYSTYNGWESVRNQCVVDSYGYFSWSYPGACICCGAPGSLDGCCDLNDQTPVCGIDGVTYANECALTCAGVAKNYDGKCTCPSTWDPVCGDSALEPGKKYTYGNECVAKSVYGVTQFTAEACTLHKLACDGDGFDPVCGLDGVSYWNVCYLLKGNGDTIALGLDDTKCSDTCENCP